MKRLSILLLVFCPGFCAVAQDATALYEEGLQLKGQQKIKEAAEKFQQAIRQKTSYTEALYELGWCRNDLKDYAGAIQALRQAIPGMRDIYKSNFELGYAFEKIASYDSAIYYYNRCLSINSNNAGVHKQLGIVAYLQENYIKGLEHFVNYEKVIKTPVSDYLYWYRKGFMQNATKNYIESKPSLQKSLEFKTDYINTYLELGFACKNLKENDDAISWYNKAITIDPKSHVPYNGIGEVYRDNIKDMDMAMNWYQKSLDMNPNERKANFGKGYCLNSKGSYPEAIPYLRKAIEMENTYTAAYVELGYSYYKTGSTVDAMTNFNYAITLNPKNENSRFYKGLIYVSQKDKANAQKMVDELKSLNSKNAASLEERVNKM
jgi:tetratricopeptide (TPR) repeat protein